MSVGFNRNPLQGAGSGLSSPHARRGRNSGHGQTPAERSRILQSGSHSEKDCMRIAPALGVRGPKTPRNGGLLAAFDPGIDSIGGEFGSTARLPFSRGCNFATARKRERMHGKTTQAIPAVPAQDYLIRRSVGFPPEGLGGSSPGRPSPAFSFASPDTAPLSISNDMPCPFSRA